MQYNFQYNTRLEDINIPLDDADEFMSFMQMEILLDYNELVESCRRAVESSGSVNQIWQIYDISPAVMHHYFTTTKQGARMLNELKRAKLEGYHKLLEKLASKNAVSEAMLKARLNDILGYHTMIDSYGYIQPNKYAVTEGDIVQAFRLFPFIGDVAAAVSHTLNELLELGTVYASVATLIAEYYEKK